MSDAPIHERFQEELRKYLDEQELQEFLVACRAPLNRSITINTSKISVQEFQNITKNR